ncbi:hypothetical protein QQ045_023798 [Rhodiola kirilowii]
MSSLASWNVRGINHPSKQAEVRYLIKKYDIGLLAVLEAKAKVAKCKSIMNGCCPVDNWKSFCFDDGLDGKSRMLLLWDPEVFTVSIWFASSQQVVCEVTWNNVSFMVGFVYAMNVQRERRELWNLMDLVSASGNISFLGQKPQIRHWFWFQAFWTKIEEFRSCLSHWHSGAGDLAQLQKRLKVFKNVVKHGLKNYMGDMNIRVDQHRQKLLTVQSSLAANPNCDILRSIEAQEMVEFKKLLTY